MFKLVEDNNGEYWVIPAERYNEWWTWHNEIFISEDWDEKYPEYATFVADVDWLVMEGFRLIKPEDLDEILLSS